MKVLVLSDSHAGMSFMRTAVQAISPQALIHLGDYFDDGCVIGEENGHIPIYQVPGNCDRFRVFDKPEILCLPVFGVRLYMTHGHSHGVKSTLSRLVREARAMGAQAALYGHTHQADCHREADGLWVINPGSCGSFGGTVAVLEIENEAITDCRILTAEQITSSAARSQ